MAWIAGLAGTVLAGKSVWDSDLGSTYAYKTANTAVASPQGATGLDPNYPSNMSLVSPQANPGVDFSDYPAQNACKALGGKLPNMQELLAIYAGRASYGNNFNMTGFYWSSTESDSSSAHAVYFGSGGDAVSTKSGVYPVRCVLDAPPSGVFDYIDYSQTGAWVRRDSTLTATPSATGFATLNDKAYYATAYDPTTGFDGTSAAVTASGSAYGGFLCEHKRRLFCAGKSTDSALLNYTALDDGNDWTGGGSIYLAGKDSGGECTGLNVWNNLIWYFSPSSTYSLDTTGEDTGWVARTISQTYGCIAPGSLVAAPNSLVFLSADGVRAYGFLAGINSPDGSGFMLLSENITPTLNAFTAAQKAAACGAYYKNRYWLAIGGKVFVCDMEKRTRGSLQGSTVYNAQPVWTQYDYANLDIACFLVTRGDEYGLYAGASDGNLYKLDSGLTDNGAAIDLMYETPPIAVGSYVTTKHFRSLDIATDGGNATQTITVTPSSDDIDGTTQTVVADAASAVRPVHMQINARGRSLKLRITSPGVAQPLSISELTVRYTPPRMR